MVSGGGGGSGGEGGVRGGGVSPTSWLILLSW